MNDISVDVSVTAAVIISTFVTELQWSCFQFLRSVKRKVL